MHAPSALLVALALAIGTTASAAPKKKVAKPTQDTGTIDAPPPIIPPATPGVGPVPEQPGNSDLCAGVRTIELDDINAHFSRLSGKSTTTIAGAKKVRTRVEVEVTASKRRLFVSLDGEVTSYDPSGGQTTYYGRARRPQLLDIPAGCEIESVAKGKGAALGDAAPEKYSREVLGTGLVDRVSCSEYYAAEKCSVSLGSVEVRLRPAQATCTSFVVQPKHIIGPVQHVHEKGNEDLESAQIHLELNTAVVGDENDMVYVALAMRLEQASGDHTTFVGKMWDELFVAKYDAPGCRVKPFYSVGNIRLTTAAKTDTGPRMYTPPQGTEGVLRMAYCNTDAPGTDVWWQPSDLVCGKLDFHPITVELIPDTRPKTKQKRKVSKQ